MQYLHHTYTKEFIVDLIFKFHWTSYIVLKTDREMGTMGEMGTMDLPPLFLPHPLCQVWEVHAPVTMTLPEQPFQYIPKCQI